MSTLAHQLQDCAQGLRAMTVAQNNSVSLEKSAEQLNRKRYSCFLVSKSPCYAWENRRREHESRLHRILHYAITRPTASAIQVTTSQTTQCRFVGVLCFCVANVAFKALQQCIIFDSHRAAIWSVACGNGQV